MLRKKTSFKPNFNPAPKPPVQPRESSPKKDEQPPPSIVEPPKEDCNQKTVIYRPTRLDPIKLSLPNSANRNVQLKDLLFKNPPLTKDQKIHKNLARKNQKKRLGVTSVVSSQESTSHTLVPQVKVGPDGQLILDEESTIINRKNPIKSQEAIVEDEEDVVSRTNYDSFRRKPSGSPARWSEEDTQKFYHGLTLFGTDFSIMESILFSGSRDRSEIHKKFKREERINKKKIDIALSKRISLTKEELDCILIEIKS